MLLLDSMYVISCWFTYILSTSLLFTQAYLRQEIHKRQQHVNELTNEKEELEKKLAAAQESKKKKRIRSRFLGHLTNPLPFFLFFVLHYDRCESLGGTVREAERYNWFDDTKGSGKQGNNFSRFFFSLVVSLSPFISLSTPFISLTFAFKRLSSVSNWNNFNLKTKTWKVTWRECKLKRTCWETTLVRCLLLC